MTLLSSLLSPSGGGLNNFTAITDPTVNDDQSQGYTKGSLWINCATNQVFICADNTIGAAVWVDLTNFGAVTFRGTWNASTNTPTLTSGVGVTGDFYIVSVGGSTNLDGITDWLPGDGLIFANSVWNKIDNTEVVYTFQTVYDVSAANPKITLTAANGPIEYRDNATPLVGDLWRVLNNAGNTLYGGVTAANGLESDIGARIANLNGFLFATAGVVGVQALPSLFKEELNIDSNGKTVFTLSQAPDPTLDAIVYVNRIAYQELLGDFSISGTTLTWSDATSGKTLQTTDDAVLVSGLDFSFSKLNANNINVPTTSTAVNYQLIDSDRRIEIDATGGDITITLPAITGDFTNKPEILLKRIDDTANDVTIVGTGGNYEDEGLILNGLEGATIYASDANIWRSTA